MVLVLFVDYSVRKITSSETMENSVALQQKPCFVGFPRWDLNTLDSFFGWGSQECSTLLYREISYDLGPV
jgi:hypothetical protein